MRQVEQFQLIEDITLGIHETRGYSIEASSKPMAVHCTAIEVGDRLHKASPFTGLSALQVTGKLKAATGALNDAVFT